MSISGDASKRSPRAHRRALYTLGTLAGLALAVLSGGFVRRGATMA